jgi:hypothetical protein
VRITLVYGFVYDMVVDSYIWDGFSWLRDTLMYGGICMREMHWFFEGIH